MPPREKPYELLEASGATYKNAKRYEGRGEVDSPELGEPSEHLSPDERAVWYGFKKEVPWLKESHRATMEVACTIRARVIHGMATVHDMKFMLQLLSHIGATPTSESRVPSDYLKRREEHDEHFDRD